MRPKEIIPEHQELYNEIGKRLKDLRTAKQLNYIKLSKEIGIARNSYNLMELGKLNFQFSTLLLVLNYHEIPVSHFFRDIGSGSKLAK
jgi:transcriptional regulator with XRE-family HTH domain